MSDIIQLLPDHVANQIAAGEVVQRPASVVKELIENAIDAQASSIKLIIKEAGKTLIQVIDDGIGMSATDARMCFERHATSKIKSAEDLFSLGTKGFRGEAMASIAAIAHVELKTKQKTLDVGTHIKIEGSKVTAQEVCVTPIGTAISVKNLFYNIPARRNFLKSNGVELRHIIDEFHRVAMAHPGIRFEMLHNGNEVFNLPVSNHRQRIVNIFGGKMNEKLVPVTEETELVTVSGFTGKPEYAKRTRGEQFFFVNNRFIKSGYLHHAVTGAFEGLLKEKTHPSYFLFLEVDPKCIDINIHPTKTEIKFDDEHALYAILRATIKHSLGQFNVAPVLDFDRDATMDTPYDYKNKIAAEPKISVDRSFNPFASETSFESGASNSGGTQQTRSYQKQPTAEWESLYAGLASGLGETNDTAGFSSLQVEDTEETGSLFIESESQQTSNNVVFQLHRKYIVTTIKSGMVVIHQNRAHYRVLYEELLRNISMANAVSQQLLFPIELMFSSKEMVLFKILKEHLELTGFVFSEIKSTGLHINAVPSVLEKENVQELLEQLFADLEDEVPDSGFSQTDMLAKSMAARLAVKTGTVMEEAQQQYLTNSLFACTEPSVTPDNKPIFVTLSVDEFDKKF